MEIQWPLALFNLAVCAASGLFIAEGILVLCNKGKQLHLFALVTSLVLVVLGGIASFFHLQHWERIFNGFGHLTSGITQELIGLLVFAIALAVFFFTMRKLDGEEALPKWLGIMAVVIGIAMVFVGAHAYGMASRPAWYGIGTYLCYYGSAFILGTSLLWAIAAFVKDKDSAMSLALWTAVGGAVAMVCTIAFGLMAQGASFSTVPSYFDPVSPTVEPLSSASIVSSVLFGENAWLFWGMAVVVGSVIPALLGVLVKKAPNSMITLAAIAVVSAFAGGLCLRAVFYLVGAPSFGIVF